MQRTVCSHKLEMRTFRLLRWLGFSLLLMLMAGGQTRYLVADFLGVLARNEGAKLGALRSIEDPCNDYERDNLHKAQH